MQGVVLSTSRSPRHSFTKAAFSPIHLLAGLGVEGDAHMGATVRHRSRRARDPGLPNLRQVHLLHAEIFKELAAKGFDVKPGELGENITVRGIDLLSLPYGARLRIGETAVLVVTGLRNPCRQIDGFRAGLMSAVLDRDSDGRLTRKAGIMAIVEAGGEVGPSNPVIVELPALPHMPLEPV